MTQGVCVCSVHIAQSLSLSLFFSPSLLHEQAYEHRTMQDRITLKYASFNVCVCACTHTHTHKDTHTHTNVYTYVHAYMCVCVCVCVCVCTYVCMYASMYVCVCVCVYVCVFVSERESVYIHNTYILKHVFQFVIVNLETFA